MITELTVLPNYGRNSGLITWKLEGSPSVFNAVVFRSPDGINGWQELGQTKQTVFEDTNLFPGNKYLEHYYQVKVQFQGRVHSSAIVSTFGATSRKEFAVARKILSMEMFQLRQHQRVLILKQKVGTKCPKCYEPESDSFNGTTLCETCYGTTYDGGYWPGIQSFLRLLTVSPQVKNDDTAGHGSTDPRMVQARMLVYPQLVKDDVIVYKEADRRYAVESCDIAYLNGKIPVSCNVTMELLPRTEMAYKFPV